jgi:hypothetical protein
MHRNKKHTRRNRRKSRRGGGYGFGGSIMGDAGGTGAGNALWGKTAGECGAPRDGNNVEMMGGRRRKRRTLRGGSRVAEGAGVEMMGGRRRSRRKQLRRRRSRRSQRGGSEPAPFESSGGRGSNPILALHQPRAGYTFTGAGAGGIADAVPSPPGVTYV